MFYHEKKGAFLIRGIFKSTRGADTVYNAARSYASLAFRVHGGSIFTTDESEQTAQSGSVTYIPQGIPFSRRSTDEDLIVIHLQALGETDGLLRVINGAEDTRQIFETMADEWELKTVGYENRCMSQLFSLFARIEKSKQNIHPKAALISNGVKLIDERFNDAAFSVSEAAAVCHISEVYFRKIYREIYGITPVRAVLSMRIECAKTYLLGGRHNVSEAAMMAGFSDVKYFSAAFKEYTGITPSLFAKMD